MRTITTAVVLLAMSTAALAQQGLGELRVPRTLSEPEQVAPPVGPGQRDQTEPGDKTTKRGINQTVYVKGELQEEDIIGPYKQPEWTQHRRFPATRVFIQQPPGGVEFEQWFELRVEKGGDKPSQVRIREELEFGLGHRLQMDLYLIQTWKEDLNHTANTIEWRAISAELRYALADWGVLPGNPTLYFEYLFFNGDENTVEPKLLLGDQFAPGWHWGVNLVYERELGRHDFRTEEFKISAGLSYSLIDTLLSVGVAMETAYEAEYDQGAAHPLAGGGGGGRAREFHLGPSLQIRPIPKAHIDIEPMWGLTGQSHRVKMFIVFGWDF